MKTIILTIMLTSFTLSNEVFAQSKKEEEVIQAVEHLRKAMIDPDSSTLSQLTFSELSYGHSGGKVEDQQSFIQTLTSGKSDFVSIDITDQTVKVIHHTAIVHHILSAQTNDGGKPGAVKLAIMSTWQKEHGEWKMLARQAVRL